MNEIVRRHENVLPEFNPAERFVNSSNLFFDEERTGKFLTYSHSMEAGGLVEMS